jgi:hypothetical protein
MADAANPTALSVQAVGSALSERRADRHGPSRGDPGEEKGAASRHNSRENHQNKTTITKTTKNNKKQQRKSEEIKGPFRGTPLEEKKIEPHALRAVRRSRDPPPSIPARGYRSGSLWTPGGRGRGEGGGGGVQTSTLVSDVLPLSADPSGGHS